MENIESTVRVIPLIKENYSSEEGIKNTLELIILIGIERTCIILVNLDKLICPFC